MFTKQSIMTALLAVAIVAVAYRVPQAQKLLTGA